MNARIRTALLVALSVTSLSAMVATSAAAAPPKALLFNPGGDSYGLPKFGFSSSTIYGYGEQVVNVRFGSRAAQLGLEPGDVILSLNGYHLTYPGSWNDALSSALYEGNWIRLKIRDVRTGHIYFRDTFVNWGGPPVQHYKTFNGNVGNVGIHVHTGMPTVTPKVVTPKIKTIKNLSSSN